jgi:hypothetical protein
MSPTPVDRDEALQMTGQIRNLARIVATSRHPDLRNRAAEIAALATWMLYDAAPDIDPSDSSS